MLVRVIKLPIKLIALSLLTLVGVIAMASTANAATYTVTNTADSGAGSLRQAITDANANGGADTIEFNIVGAGPHTITIGATELPEITGPTNIDATTQTDSSCGTLVPTLPSASNTPHNLQIVLDGSSITWINYEQGILHFVDGSEGSSVSGISFINAGADGPDYINGISIEGTFGGPVSDYVIECNYFGIEPDGTTEAPNYGSGIQARYEVSGIVLRNNLVSASQAGGYAFYDNNDPQTSTGNIVEENLFGTLADGLTPASYNQSLLYVEGTNSLLIQRNVLGGTSSLFDTAAYIDYTNNSVLQNNYIGLNINQGALPSAGSGINSNDNSNSTINDNLIANNSFFGILSYSFGLNNTITDNTIYNNPGTGASINDNSTFTNNNVHNNDNDGVRISGNGVVSQNNIYSNGGDGIFLSSAIDAIVRGNNVGLDSNDTPSGNGGDGIEISSSSYNSTIGGTNVADRNYIADNVGSGIHIYNDIGGTCGRTNTVSTTFNNYIGTNTSGQIQSGFGNGGSGININEVNLGDQCGGIESVYKHQIGGDNTGEPNVIAGNNEDGIRIYQADNQQTGADVFSGSFVSNSIFGNSNLGINLAADTANSGTADADLGPNPLNNNLMSYPAVNANYYLNRPTINSAAFSGNEITVNYDFQANGVQQGNELYETDLVGYRLDFYLNDAGQDGAYAGYSQGKTHIGNFVVNGSETGATHTFTSPVVPSAGQNVTATTTVLWLNREAISCGPPVYYGPPYGSTCL